MLSLLKQSRILKEGVDILDYFETWKELQYSRNPVIEVEIQDVSQFQKTENDIQFFNELNTTQLYQSQQQLPSSSNNLQPPKQQQQSNKDKFILKEICSSDDSYKQEIEIVKSIRSLKFRIPGLVYLVNYAVYETGDNVAAYILMESGEMNLAQFIERRNKSNQPIQQHEFISILRQTISSLAEMQKVNIAHNDIKPANILVFRRPKKKSEQPKSSRKVVTSSTQQMKIENDFSATFSPNKMQNKNNSNVSKSFKTIQSSTKFLYPPPALEQDKSLSFIKEEQDNVGETQKNEICYDIEVKLCDIGSCQMNQKTIKRSKKPGTESYYAPEQFQGGELHIYKYDVFSLGMCFIYMVMQKTSNLSYYMNIQYWKNLTGSDKWMRIFEDILSDWIRITAQRMGKSEEIKQILTLMLKVDYHQRPDFIELKNIFEDLFDNPNRQKEEVSPNSQVSLPNNEDLQIDNLNEKSEQKEEKKQPTKSAKGIEKFSSRKLISHDQKLKAQLNATGSNSGHTTPVQADFPQIQTMQFQQYGGMSSGSQEEFSMKSSDFNLNKIPMNESQTSSVQSPNLFKINGWEDYQQQDSVNENVQQSQLVAGVSKKQLGSQKGQFQIHTLPNKRPIIKSTEPSPQIQPIASYPNLQFDTLVNQTSSESTIVTRQKSSTTEKKTGVINLNPIQNQNQNESHNNLVESTNKPNNQRTNPPQQNQNQVILKQPTLGITNMDLTNSISSSLYFNPKQISQQQQSQPNSQSDKKYVNGSIGISDGKFTVSSRITQPHRKAESLIPTSTARMFGNNSNGGGMQTKNSLYQNQNQPHSVTSSVSNLHSRKTGSEFFSAQNSQSEYQKQQMHFASFNSRFQQDGIGDYISQNLLPFGNPLAANKSEVDKLPSIYKNAPEKEKLQQLENQQQKINLLEKGKTNYLSESIFKKQRHDSDHSNPNSPYKPQKSNINSFQHNPTNNNSSNNNNSNMLGSQPTNRNDPSQKVTISQSNQKSSRYQNNSQRGKSNFFSTKLSISTATGIGNINLNNGAQTTSNALNGNNLKFNIPSATTASHKTQSMSSTTIQTALSNQSLSTTQNSNTLNILLNPQSNIQTRLSSKSLSEQINENFEQITVTDYKAMNKFQNDFIRVSDSNKKLKYLTMVISGNDNTTNYGMLNSLYQLDGVVHLTIQLCQQKAQVIDQTLNVLETVCASVQNLTLIFKDCNYKDHKNDTQNEFLKKEQQIIIDLPLHVIVRFESKEYEASGVLETLCTKLTTYKQRISTLNIDLPKKQLSHPEKIINILKQFPSFSSLNSLGLDLSQNSLKQADSNLMFQALEQFQSLHTLSLNISNNKPYLFDNTIISISLPHSLETLYLNLSQSVLSTTVIVTLQKAVKHCKNLTTFYIYLSNCSTNLSPQEPNLGNLLLGYFPEVFKQVKKVGVFSDSNKITDDDFALYSTDLLKQFNTEILTLSLSDNFLTSKSFQIICQMIKMQTKLKQATITFPRTILKQEIIDEFENLESQDNDKNGNRSYILSIRNEDFSYFKIQIDIAPKRNPNKKKSNLSIKTFKNASQTFIPLESISHNECWNLSKQSAVFQGYFCITCYENNCLRSDSYFCLYCIKTCHLEHSYIEINEFPTTQLMCSCNEKGTSCESIKQLQSINNNQQNNVNLTPSPSRYFIK